MLQLSAVMRTLLVSCILKIRNARLSPAVASSSLNEYDVKSQVSSTVLMRMGLVTSKIYGLACIRQFFD